MNEKELCLSLAKADSEEEAIEILKEAGYWDDPDVWQYYGNIENNFASIGNQQSKPDAALVEKIVNSVDAVLMRECLRQGIDPEEAEAPSSINEALDTYFGIYRGRLSNLTARERTRIAENIILVATGKKSDPSYAIIDKGEGQTPKKIPDTFLSLPQSSNKLRIPFVQGKYNMGGTGALLFCGRHNLHLIISKRDPKIKKEDDETKDYWGFTIVRRENPEKGVKNSVFKYLAQDGKILMFKAESLPLLPGDYPVACINPLEWGTCVKVYNYQLTGLKTLAILDLYNRLSLLLPNIALPVRMYERRKGYTGHTLEATLSGLNVRLDDDKRANLEPGFQRGASSNIKVMGQEMKIQIYAFKKGRREKYSRDEGIMFIVDGQAQGFLSKSFFSRKSVGMSYLDDSILVLVDCTEFEGRYKEDLFMNSRDRLRAGELRSKIERELEELLKKHPGLRELKERRRREEIAGKIGDSKPLVDVIEKVIKKSPTLSKLFVEGVKLPNPFDLRGLNKDEIFKGRQFPTFLKLKEDCPEEKPKHCPINRRFRVQFETDAENEYFERDANPGEFSLNSNGKAVDDHVLNLWNGTANLTVKLPDWAKVEDIIYFECEVEDVGHTESFFNEFYVKVENPETKLKEGKTGKRKKPRGKESGKDREGSSLLDLPNIREVTKDEWKKFGFDNESALLVKYGGEEEGHDFYVNMDNIHLQTEIKGNPKGNPTILKARYTYGMVLIGLALLKEFENNEQKDKEEENGNIYQEIPSITRAISPFLLPMISSLGEIEAET
ncbi:MAG: hypothetical protein KAT65_16195 [Methanophagales archaeon]|nr:hypothetical protein [Methanophagales archaeon]